jgi:hypothetical protein
MVRSAETRKELRACCMYVYIYIYRYIQVRINHMAHWADARGPAGGRGPAAAGPTMLHACIVIGLTICTTWSENTNRKLSE